MNDSGKHEDKYLGRTSENENDAVRKGVRAGVT